MLRHYHIICLAGCLLAGCSHSSGPPRQDSYPVRPSNYVELLPEAKSISRQYTPSTLHDSPNSPVAYHVTPGISYEDETLDINLAGSLELADYYRAVKRAGWQRWLQASGPYTVLAIPNDVLENYGQSWPGGLFGQNNQARLAKFVGQTIIKGKWLLPRIKKEAGKAGGIVTVESINGIKLTLRPLVNGSIQVIGPEGQTRLQPGYYPQANGVFYVSDTLLPASEPPVQPTKQGLTHQGIRRPAP